MGWRHEVAKVVKRTGGLIQVRCPFCENRHVHSRLSLGSKEVVAGCHLGGDRCLSYAIPEP